MPLHTCGLRLPSTNRTYSASKKGTPPQKKNNTKFQSLKAKYKTTKNDVIFQLFKFLKLIIFVRNCNFFWQIAEEPQIREPWAPFRKKYFPVGFVFSARWKSDKAFRPTKRGGSIHRHAFDWDRVPWIFLKQIHGEVCRLFGEWMDWHRKNWLKNLAIFAPLGFCVLGALTKNTRVSGISEVASVPRKIFSRFGGCSHLWYLYIKSPLPFFWVWKSSCWYWGGGIHHGLALDGEFSLSTQLPTLPVAAEILVVCASFGVLQSTWHGPGRHWGQWFLMFIGGVEES